MFFSLDEFIDAGDARGLSNGDEVEFSVIESKPEEESNQNEKSQRRRGKKRLSYAVRLRRLPRGSVSFVSDVNLMLFFLFFF